jgi:hypothetical protein
LARGDHLFVWRRYRGVPFQHHAIDLGDGTVVHFADADGGAAGPGRDFRQFEIIRTSIDVIRSGGADRVHVVSHRERLDREETAARALQQVGRGGYDLVFDNCEHFALWCVCGSETSRQVESVIERFAAAAVKVVVTGAVRRAAQTGLRGVLRGATPWMLAADAAQLATEAMGHHVGFHDPRQRRTAGRAVGMATSIGLGAVGGPVGMAVGGGLWLAGEMFGEVSRSALEQCRQRRQTDEQVDQRTASR